MKSLNRDEPGCNFTSSNCVIWQGPDLDCIKLCKGDSISDVVAKLATELCTVLDELDVTTYDLSCLKITTAPPTKFHDFIQLLVETICALQTATGVITPIPIITTGPIPIATMFQFTDALGNLVTTLPVPSYVEAIGNAVNVQDQQIAVLETVTAVHTTQITDLQTQVTAIPDNSLPLIVPDPCILPAVPTAIADVVTAMSTVLCSLQAATGTPTELYVGVSKQCAGLASAKTLSNPLVAYSGIPGWNLAMNNAAAAINNMELVLCDVISAIKTVQLCCNSGCSSISLALYATVTTTDVNIFLTGIVPIQFVDCAGPGSLVTITDANGNFFTTHMSILGFVNVATGFVVSTSLTPVDPTTNLTVTIMPCLIDNATATTCQSVLSYVIISQANCPVMTYTPTTNSISFSGVPTVGTNTYDVQLYDSTATTLLSSVSQGITFPTVFVGNFPGLGPNISYTLRVVITNSSGATTECPFFGVALTPTAFVKVPLLTALNFAALSKTGMNSALGSSTFAGLPTLGSVGDLTATYVNIVAGDVVTGTLYTIAADPAVVAANLAVTNAIAYVGGLTVVTIADNISGTTIFPGYYDTTTNTVVINPASTVTLDALGDPTAVFVIRASSTFVAGAGAIISLINGATFDNVFWQITGTTTIGAGATFKGTVLGGSTITLGNAVNVQGAVYTETNIIFDTDAILNL
jgi:hypothetical protein